MNQEIDVKWNVLLFSWSSFFRLFRCISPFVFYSCTWFNADFHKKFVSPGIEHAKTFHPFNTVAVFIKLLFIYFAFVLTKVSSKNQKLQSTTSFSFTWLSFAFAFVLSLVHLIFFFFYFFLIFAKRTISFDFVVVFFYSYIWNYWLHNGPVKIKAISICASASRMECKERFLLKREVKVYDFNIER